MSDDFHGCELSGKLLNEAFPFHLVISASGTIVSCGKSLTKALKTPNICNTDVFSHFSILNPRHLTSPYQLSEHQKTLFILRATENPTLIMRGQVISLNDASFHAFLITPSVTDTSSIQNLGFTLSDFALHSSLSDFLILVEAQRTSLKDSQTLSKELRTLNADLEERVQSRTQQLEVNAQKLLDSKQTLEQEMAERQRVEIELRHAHKMEAVGQLAAGIAHEINTPMQYIGSSLQFLKSSFADLQNLSQKLEESLPLIQGHEAVVEATMTAVEEADLDYLRERVPKALDRALEGIERVTQIVGALNEFSHPDQRVKSGADINRAIETTLKVATNEYKYVAEVVTDFQTIPPVECHLGGINQVFLNLIVNAAHAIAATEVKKGLITIRTWQNNDSVRISISDNGSGIPEDIQHRIFDPFFTTKEIGRGTGQGLAISHKIIIENHGGLLFFETEPGAGTTFHIALPIKCSDVISPSIEPAADRSLAA